MAVRPITLGPQMGLQSVGPFEGFEGASQAFGRGAVLVEDSAQLDEGAADPASGIVGFSADSATGTTGAACAFYPALEGIIFEGNLSNEDSSSPPTARDTVVSDFLTRNSLVPDTSQTPDVWYVDTSEVTNLSVTVIGFRDPVGTSDGRVYFVINADTTIYAT